MTKPLDPLPWVQFDSQSFLLRLQSIIEDIILPAWIPRPPFNFGLPAAGTPKAHTWRTIFNIHMPLALLSFCQIDSPIRSMNAEVLQSVLHTSMALTCASLLLQKKKITADEQERFKEYLRQHVK